MTGLGFLMTNWISYGRFSVGGKGFGWGDLDQLHTPHPSTLWSGLFD